MTQWDLVDLSCSMTDEEVERFWRWVPDRKGIIAREMIDENGKKYFQRGCWIPRTLDAATRCIA
jgi:hypothetical protein